MQLEFFANGSVLAGKRESNDEVVHRDASRNNPEVSWAIVNAILYTKQGLTCDQGLRILDTLAMEKG